MCPSGKVKDFSAGWAGCEGATGTAGAAAAAVLAALVAGVLAAGVAGVPAAGVAAVDAAAVGDGDGGSGAGVEAEPAGRGLSAWTFSAPCWAPQAEIAKLMARPAAATATPVPKRLERMVF
jgi:hypothetical protein